MASCQTLHDVARALYEWRVVARIRVEERSRRKIQPTDERGHEHGVLVVDTQLFIDTRKDSAWAALPRSERLDERLGYGHQKGSRNALARHVTNAQPQLVFRRHEEVVEVATYFASRAKHSPEICIEQRRKTAGHHAHLDVPSDVELVLHAAF